jgi:hypothetical protein
MIQLKLLRSPARGMMSLVETMVKKVTMPEVASNQKTLIGGIGLKGLGITSKITLLQPM